MLVVLSRGVGNADISKIGVVRTILTLILLTAKIINEMLRFIQCSVRQIGAVNDLKALRRRIKLCNKVAGDGAAVLVLIQNNLSLKAKGLLSMMLSLPDEWNYTTRGLAAICKEGVDAIGKTLKELELAGYIIRRQLRGKDGRISDTEYTIFEKPRKPSPPDTTLPDTENPYLDNPDTEAPDTDNPAQLNTKKSNTQKSNTDRSSTHSFFLPAADGMTDGFEKKAEIREQIEYDILCQQYDRMQLDELVEIMLEVAMNRSPTVKIGRDAEYPTGFVQQRFEKITSMHIEKVMDGIRENTTRVWNTKAYLMAALFNSVSTIDNHYAMLVNHDFHGGP